MNSRPQNASRTARPQAKQKAPAHTTAHTEIFRPERTHLLAIGLMFIVTFMIVAWAPTKLFWLLLFPLLGAWWVLRARTTVGERGIAIRYGFRGSRSLSWDDVAGVGFQRARAFVSTRGDDKLTLPGVTFNSLPRLAEASRGRIPDALTAGKEAADEKVVVIHRDGQQVMMSKDEFDAYPNAQAD